MEQIWWNHITKAHKFMEDIAKAALSEESVVLSLPSNVPWRNTIIDVVRERLQMENPKNKFEEITCPEEEFGLYLLNRYCKREKRATYRYGMTYAQFLGKCEDIVLNDRYIWIRDIPETKLDSIVPFIMEYQKNVEKKTPAVFILETHNNNVKIKKGVKRLSFDNNISAYDKFAFCALIATENNCSDYMRPYLAELVSNICNEDIELCAKCVKAGKTFLANPINVIHSVQKSQKRSDGEPFLFTKEEEQIKKAIWETQIRYIFPLIEKYRSNFVVQYKTLMEKALPIQNAYGEVISRAEDVEIGMILFMVGSKVITISQKERDELKKYREARNRLAHLDVLELDLVEDILKKGSK